MSKKIVLEPIEIAEQCKRFRKQGKGVHCVDLGESFPPSLYLQKSASIQPRTSPSKFGGKIQFNIHFTPYPGVRGLTEDRECPRGSVLVGLQCAGAFCAQKMLTCDAVVTADASDTCANVCTRSRRAAAGRAQLLAKSAHAGHLRLPAEPLEVAEKFGKLQRLGIRNFRKMLHFGKIPKKFGQIWRKFSKILAKIAKFWKKNSKTFSNF